MLLQIKLYSHLTCNNPDLPFYGRQRFTLELSVASTLQEIHNLLNLGPGKYFVSIVNGHSQQPDYLIDSDCSISIFLPMAERQYDFFEKI